jgi:hypothetical protein
MIASSGRCTFTTSFSGAYSLITRLPSRRTTRFLPCVHSPAYRVSRSIGQIEEGAHPRSFGDGAPSRLSALAMPA